MGKKAVLVGCNYPGTKAVLHGCVNDVWRIHRTLVERFGFDEKDITVLIDTDRKYTQPTGANIKRALNKLVTESEAGDVLFFHYSGHGTRLPAETGEHDDTGYDECIVPCDMNLMTDDDFREIVDKVPQGVILTIVSDSCHSGGLIDGSKEQIGDSTQSGGSGGTKEFGLRDFVSQSVHEALESSGLHLPSFGHGHGHGYYQHHEDDRRFQQVEYSGSGSAKSRSLPLSTLLDILKQKTGKDDINVGNIRPTLFDMFGEDSSSKVKKFVKVLVQRLDKGGEESSGGLMGIVGSLAQQFLQHKLDEADDSSSYIKPALQTSIEDQKMAYAGAKIANSKHVKDMGILLSGCQSSETSADANPTGNPDRAYGAMSNAVQSILSDHHGPITNRELITRARQLLRKQGFSQHPGLYCNDQNAESPFIC